MSVKFNFHIPSLALDTIENTARECAAVWRRFQEDLPAFVELASSDTKDLEKFAREARKRWDHILVLGIGGSSLGAQAVTAGVLGTVPNLRRKPSVHFLDNVDPVETTALLRSLCLRKTLMIVISKSGSTLETLANFFLVKEKLGKSWQKQVVVITGSKKGYLKKLAEKEKLPSFEIPEQVGGRYSVFSACGLLPAALAGVRARDLLAGAREVQATDAFHFALVQAELYTQGHNITVFCPYARSLKCLGEWYCQLLAESIGKHKKIGITPEVSLGATDQHSKLQLWSAGPADKFYIFLGVESFAKDLQLKGIPTGFPQLNGKWLSEILSAELAGTLQALQEKGRPFAFFDLPNLSARSIGYLLQFFMLQVAFLGEILGVNPYDQPGVERGKELTKKFLGKK